MVVGSIDEERLDGTLSGQDLYRSGLGDGMSSIAEGAERHRYTGDVLLELAAFVLAGEREHWTREAVCEFLKANAAAEAAVARAMCDLAREEVASC